MLWRERYGVHAISAQQPSESCSIHEREFVRAFIQRERRERALFLLSDPKHRREFTDKLAHFRWFDQRFIAPIPGRMAHTADELIRLLKQKGAGPSVWVISEFRDIDGREMPIEEAMNSVWGAMKGSVLSCVPGRLAFFRGEEMKSELLLQHP